MAHYGMLRDYRFSDNVDDIRGATLYGRDGDKLGKIDDVIFDHASGTIQYAVVDTGGWLSSKKFLVPAERIHPDAKNTDDFAIDMTREQIEALPRYDESATRTDSDWNDYDRRYREAWEKGPLLQKAGSTHTITPEPTELPAGTGSGVDDQAYMPERIAGVFTDAAPEPGKIRMRPSGLAARAEDSRTPGAFAPEEKPTLAEEEAEDRAVNNPGEAQRDHLTDPNQVYTPESVRHARWAAFEENLRRNRVDITASCHSCGPARDKVA
jgi:sporulation protein YlmC with PRC-barrel domain